MCENSCTAIAVIGGDDMNKIKELLRKYLCEDAIVVCELSEKSGDFVWLESQGYFDRETGKETEKGRAYTKKHDALMLKHFERIKDNSLDDKNLNKLRNELNKYISQNPQIDIYKGLTETEAFAYRYVNHGRW